MTRKIQLRPPNIFAHRAEGVPAEMDIRGLTWFTFNEKAKFAVPANLNSEGVLTELSDRASFAWGRKIDFPIKERGCVNLIAFFETEDAERPSVVMHPTPYTTIVDSDTIYRFTMSDDRVSR